MTIKCLLLYSQVSNLWEECILLHVLLAVDSGQKLQPRLWGIHPPSKLQPKQSKNTTVQVLLRDNVEIEDLWYSER